MYLFISCLLLCIIAPNAGLLVFLLLELEGEGSNNYESSTYRLENTYNF
jgi:hypothetical protein